MGVFKLPKEEIKLAAKTGFLTRDLWREFFSYGDESWKLKQWKNLLTRGHFRKHPSRRADDTLVLNYKNRDVIKLVGAEISAPPYIAQLTHDEIATRSVLRLQKQGLLKSFLTESELKTQNAGQERVRSAKDRIKYPDMIIELARKDKSISLALEIELSRKDYQRYYRAIGNYSTRTYADKVLYIGSTEGIFVSLRKAMRENSYSSHRQPIGFVSSVEWEKSPATAPIYFNDYMTSIAQINAEI